MLAILDSGLDARSNFGCGFVRWKLFCANMNFSLNVQAYVGTQPSRNSKM